MKKSKDKLGRILLNEKVITEEELKKALEVQKKEGDKLGDKAQEGLKERYKIERKFGEMKRWLWLWQMPLCRFSQTRNSALSHLNSSESQTDSEAFNWHKL